MERERLWEVEMARFRYLAWGIGRSSAERFVRREEPLAWALAALMRPRRWRPARHKLECLRPIARAAGLDDARRFLLANCVETYLQLTDEERPVYQRLREDRRETEVIEMEMTWAEQMAKQYQDKYLQQGLAEGLEQGRVEGMRRLIVQTADRRWGGLSEAARRRVEALDSTEALERLHDRLLTAASLDDAGLA